MYRIIIALTLTSILALADCTAQVPQTLSYQGLLTGPGGNPVSDTLADLAFGLYAADTGGTPVWTETHTGVALSNGAFSVVLGSLNPLGGVDFGEQLYIGVALGSDPEFSPRSALTSAPSALAPWVADPGGIHYPSGKVGIGAVAGTQELEVAGNADISGTIYKSGQPLIHSTGNNSFFVGIGAGTLAASSWYSVGIGPSALTSLSYGIENTALGYHSLLSTIGGSQNTAVGYEALRNNTSGNNNTAIGDEALSDNTTGYNNTAVGIYALEANTSGIENAALGYFALGQNSSNRGNTGLGYVSLFQTTASDFNTAVGANAGSLWNNGYNNVFVGANVDVNGAGYYNVIAIGQATVVTSSSTARFGNAATGSYGGWAGWSNVSDGRFKKNVREDVPGLAFINKLRPITYNFDATGMEIFLHKNDRSTLTAIGDDRGMSVDPDRELSAEARAINEKALLEKEQVTYTGFVAQEVEVAAREVGFNFSGVDAPKNKDDYYSLRYAEFVVPLVAAVQEQQKIIDELLKRIDKLEAASNARK